jgi:hypothetical protein
MNRYQTDFYGWTQEQAALLKAGRLNKLDVENLIEELEAMGRSEKRALESRLAVLLTHLLKWQYQSERRGKSWNFTIGEQRRKINKLMLQNPALRAELPAIIGDAYEDAIYQASYETGINAAVFPKSCPWPFDCFIDAAFFPDLEI